jgi:hypothetical protein
MARHGHRRPGEKWLSTLRPTTLIVVRSLILANVALLGIVGALYLAFAARPAGPIVAGVIWLAAVALALVLPGTNPRRGGSRW